VPSSEEITLLEQRSLASAATKALTFRRGYCCGFTTLKSCWGICAKVPLTYFGPSALATLSFNGASSSNVIPNPGWVEQSGTGPSWLTWLCKVLTVLTTFKVCGYDLITANSSSRTF
jgi:hypothetical protein